MENGGSFNSDKSENFQKLIHFRRPIGKLIKVKRDGHKQSSIFSYEEDDEGLIANCGELSSSPLQFDSFGTLVVEFSEIVRVPYCPIESILVKS